MLEKKAKHIFSKTHKMLPLLCAIRKAHPKCQASCTIFSYTNYTFVLLLRDLLA